MRAETNAIPSRTTTNRPHLGNFQAVLSGDFSVDDDTPGQEIHIILDNLSAHKTHAVREFLEQNPRVRFHFTPTYSSWLNQVQIWFAKIECDVIARAIFTSVSDLARKLRRYINAYSANPRHIQWKYSNTSRRIRTNEFIATGH